MKIAILHLVYTVTGLVIFGLRIFYSISNKNIFDNIYKIFDYKMPEIKSLIYFYLITTMLFVNAFLRKKNTMNHVIIIFLIILNLFIIMLSMKTW
ncbi:hypothetical protein IO90_08335 [Chryseobacterium sp. FH1]|nr:hypothetical protein IO90_08335 [Chryseobacterium sp. FH1]